MCSWPDLALAFSSGVPGISLWSALEGRLGVATDRLGVRGVLGVLGVRGVRGCFGVPATLHLGVLCNRQLCICFTNLLQQHIYTLKF